MRYLAECSPWFFFYFVYQMQAIQHAKHHSPTKWLNLKNVNCTRIAPFCTIYEIQKLSRCACNSCLFTIRQLCELSKVSFPASLNLFSDRESNICMYVYAYLICCLYIEIIDDYSWVWDTLLLIAAAVFLFTFAVLPFQ